MNSLVHLGKIWNPVKPIQPPILPRTLSICIPSLTERFPLLMRLLWQLQPQIDKFQDEVEILVLADSRAIPIGTKMDALATMAAGRFVTMVADDDLITSNYVESLVNTIKLNPKVDVISFDFMWHKRGQGVEYLTESQPTDKAAIRLDLRQRLQHEPLFDNEDTRFAKLLYQETKTSYHINEVLYEIWHDPGKEDTPEKRKLRGIHEASRIQL